MYGVGILYVIYHIYPFTDILIPSQKDNVLKIIFAHLLPPENFPKLIP